MQEVAPSTPRSLTRLFGKRRFDNRSPRPFVVESMAHLIGEDPTDDTSCEALLVCQPTGVGKSTVTQLCGVMLPGIVIGITPTLSLNADQVGKLRKYGQKETYAINLDDHSGSIESMNNIVEKIKGLMKSRRKMLLRTVFVFVSPMLATNKKKPFYEMFMLFASKCGIGAVVLDEIQLLVEHGSFRDEVRMMKPFLRDLKNASPTSNIRFVGLCATMTAEDERRADELLGIQFTKKIMATPREMSRRAIDIHLEVSKVKDYLDEIVRSEENHNALIFTQTQKRVETLAQSLSNIGMSAAVKAEAKKKALSELQVANGKENHSGGGSEDNSPQTGIDQTVDDENADPRNSNINLNQSDETTKSSGDASGPTSVADFVKMWSCIQLHGDMRSQTKSFGINLFCGNLPESPLSKFYKMAVFTGGLGSAGVSNPNIRLVVMDGLPETHGRAVQMAGRLIRGIAVEGQKYRFVVVISTNSFGTLLRRTYNSGTDWKHIKDEVRRHESVLKAFIYDQVCLHYYWENMFGRTKTGDSSEYLDPTCAGHCPFCSGKRTQMFVRVSQEKLRKSLCLMFRSEMRIPMTDFTARLLVEGTKQKAFLQKARNIPLSGSSVPKYSVDALAMQLYCAGIVQHTTIKVDGVIHIYLELCLDANLHRIVDNPAAFQNIDGITLGV